MITMSLPIKIGIVTAAIGIGLGTRYVFKMPADNSIEEYAEQVIKGQTGYDVDLSPESPE